MEIPRREAYRRLGQLEPFNCSEEHSLFSHGKHKRQSNLGVNERVGAEKSRRRDGMESEELTVNESNNETALAASTVLFDARQVCERGDGRRIALKHG